MLLRDETIAEQVRQSVTKAQSATSELKGAAANAGALVSDLQSKGLPKRSTTPGRGVKQTATNLNAASKDIRQTVTDFTGPDKEGRTAAVTLRESLSNVNVAAANMADDTEALKHNFLLRGFFRKRGYYNLAALSPDPYRKNPLFTAQNNDRAWLSADQLFRTGAHGQGGAYDPWQVSPQLRARSLRRKAFSEPNKVIEGYSDGDDGGGRAAVSRLRSMLVRDYLQSHYHLDSNNLGTVFLEDRPPDGSGRTQWNGVAIVLLRAKP